MWKRLKWIVFAAVIAFVCYQAYDGYRAGYHTRPDMPEGAFSISYKNGMRAILVDVPNEQETRRYLGFPLDVPFYVRDAWSYCSPPTKEESDQASVVVKARDWPGERIEAICKINVENAVVLRGMITSVPKL